MSTMPDESELQSAKEPVNEESMVDLTFNEEEVITKIYDDLKDYQDLYDRLDKINTSSLKAISAKIDKVQNDILQAVGDAQGALDE